MKGFVLDPSQPPLEERVDRAVKDFELCPQCVMGELFVVLDEKLKPTHIECDYCIHKESI